MQIEVGGTEGCKSEILGRIAAETFVKLCEKRFVCKSKEQAYF